MANIKSAAILTRIREVLEDSAGTLRTVPSARYLGELPEGLADNAQLVRAATTPRVEASIIGLTRSPASPPVMGNLLLYDLEVQVKVVRITTPLEQLDDDSRVALQALAIEDADIIRQALEFPGNLRQTAAAVATDLVSGMLTYASSSVTVRRQIDEGAQPLETIHKFTAVAIARPATS